MNGTAEERNAFEKKLLAEHPEYLTQICPELLENKKNFFGKYLSAWKIMKKHPEVKALGFNGVNQLARDIFVSGILDKAPIDMLKSQKFRTSILLYTVKGKTCFYLRSDNEEQMNDTNNTVVWIKENVKKARIVWLGTAANEEVLTKKLKKMAIPLYMKYKPSLLSISDRILEFKDGELTER